MDKFPLFSDLGGSFFRALRHPGGAPEWSAFNPSIGYSDADGFLCLFRSANYWYGKSQDSMELLTGNRVVNKTYVSKLDKNLKILKLEEVEYLGFDFPLTRGPEDAKLYYKNGRWELTAIIKEPSGVLIPAVATFWLDGSKAHLIKLWPSPDPSVVEKNWMVPYGDANFLFVYGPNKIYDGTSVSLLSPDSFSFLKGLRGGSNLYPLDDGTYLGICHRTRITKSIKYNPRIFGYASSSSRNYTHVFTKYSSEGKILQVSREFQFLGPGIEFASGLVVVDGTVHVSFGYKDLASYFGTIGLDKVMEAMIDC